MKYPILHASKKPLSNVLSNHLTETIKHSPKHQNEMSSITFLSPFDIL